MSFKLFTEKASFRAFKILIAAEYNGVDIEVVTVEKGSQVACKTPTGRLPALETAQGTVFESNAIARFVAGLRRDTGLTGATFFESAQVDAWVDFVAHDIDLPAVLLSHPILELLPYNAAACEKAKADLARALGVLEAHLADKTYLVGDKITLADIVAASSLLYPFKFVADPAFRAPFPNVFRWFDTLVHQPQFENVIGEVVLATKDNLAALSSSSAAAPAAAGAGAAKGGDKAPKEKKEKAPKAEKPKEEKPKAEKKEKPKKEEDDDEPEPDFVPEKKAEHPFKILDRTNPTTFVMDTWKKTYSNCESYTDAMNTFWSTFDPAGWSIFRGDYQYNEELKVLFMTSNLIGGFIQRTDEIRKWLFGSMTIRGEEGKAMKVTCYYLIRGDSIQPLIDCNDDAACYTWTKIPIPASETDKQLLHDYWCSEGPLEGEPNLDSRCYK